MDIDKPDGTEGPRIFYPLRRGVLITEQWFRAQQRKLAIRDLDQVGYRQSSTLVTRRGARRIVAERFRRPASSRPCERSEMPACVRWSPVSPPRWSVVTPIP